MNKFITIALATLAIVFSSCSKDAYTPEESEQKQEEITKTRYQQVLDLLQSTTWEVDNVYTKNTIYKVINHYTLTLSDGRHWKITYRNTSVEWIDESAKPTYEAAVNDMLAKAQTIELNGDYFELVTDSQYPLLYLTKNSTTYTYQIETLTSSSLVLQPKDLSPLQNHFFGLYMNKLGLSFKAQ